MQFTFKSRAQDRRAKGCSELCVRPEELNAKSIPRLRTLLWRGMHQRCPQCGQGPIFTGWIKVCDRCSICGLQYLPDQGDVLAFQVVVDRALFIFPLIVLL